MWAGWISCWSQPFLREFFPGTPVFHSPPKCNISKYQFLLYTVRTRLTYVRGNRNNSFTISTASLSETNTALSIGAPCKLLVTRPWPIPEKKMKIVVNGRFVPALWESSLPLSRSKTGCSRTSRLWAGEGGGRGSKLWTLYSFHHPACVADSLQTEYKDKRMGRTPPPSGITPATFCHFPDNQTARVGWSHDSTLTMVTFRNGAAFTSFQLSIFEIIVQNTPLLWIKRYDKNF